MQIDWLGHDGIRITTDGLVVYVDPFKIEGGAPADILPVNHTFRGVVVPEGRHDVRLVFEPASHRTGIIVSAVSTTGVFGALLLLLGLGYRERRRHADSAGSPDDLADGTSA